MINAEANLVAVTAKVFDCYLGPALLILSP